MNLSDTKVDEHIAVVVVDQDLLQYRNSGLSAAPAGSVAAQLYKRKFTRKLLEHVGAAVVASFGRLGLH